MPTADHAIGIYVLPGRVLDPARGLQEAEEAETLGFSRVWLGERYDLKEAGVLCGALAARTTHIGVATGLVSAASRHPLMTAALGATMQSTFPGRFGLGIGRGVDELGADQGFRAPDLEGFADYCSIVRRLWAGETISYDGKAGRYPAMRLADPPPAGPPELILGTWFAGSGSAALAARVFDAVLLGPLLTADAVQRAVRRLRDACAAQGREPATLRILATVMMAPDLSPDEELAVVNARAVTYLQFRGLGRQIVEENGWSLSVLDDFLGHETFASMARSSADQSFHRRELLNVASLLPPQWMADAAAIGPAKQCAARVEDYFAAGADEVVMHGTSPGQNAAVLRALR